MAASIPDEKCHILQNRKYFWCIKKCSRLSSGTSDAICSWWSLIGEKSENQPEEARVCATYPSISIFALRIMRTEVSQALVRTPQESVSYGLNEPLPELRLFTESSELMTMTMTMMAGQSLKSFMTERNWMNVFIADERKKERSRNLFSLKMVFAAGKVGRLHSFRTIWVMKCHCCDGTAVITSL